MTTGLLRSALRWLIGVVLGSSALPVFGSTILVREELGFSFAPGLQWTLASAGPSAVYDLTGSFGAGALFNLSYSNDLFTMTALANNTVATAGSLPFGIDIFPGSVVPITPDFDCQWTSPCYNGIGFIAWFSFPQLAGGVLNLAVPPQAAVAEPATWLLMALALTSLAWARRRAALGIIRSKRQARLIEQFVVGGDGAP